MTDQHQRDGMSFVRLFFRSPVTSAFFIISVIVAISTSLGDNESSLRYVLQISAQTNGSLIEISQGELWRLITPIFLHFSILHILFNMMWLIQLGIGIEIKQSSWHLIVLILSIAILSNLAQYYWSLNPNFGGMSGVDFGLLGYTWIIGRLNPRLGIGIDNGTVIFMLAWFALCWSGALGAIANMAHTIGLLIGIVFALLLTIKKRSEA